MAAWLQDAALDTVKPLTEMDFPERLATLRRQRGLTQQALADLVQVHVTHLRRYEGGRSQPTLDVLRRLAVALGVSADLLLFDQNERGPAEELLLLFESAQRLDPDEMQLVKSLIEGILLKHEAKRWTQSA